MPTLIDADMFGLAAATVNMIVLGLLLLVTLLILFFLYRLIRRPRFASSRRSKHARLAVTDAALIDERRKLVLVRRDDVEHLVLIGGATDVIIESNIRKNAPANPVPQPNARTTAQPTAQPQPAASNPVRTTSATQAPAPRPITPHPPRPAVSTTQTKAPDVSATSSPSAPTVSAVGTPAVSKAAADTSARKDRSVDQMDALLDEITPKR